MRDFREIIKETSNQFLLEAKQSPQLLADMAMMEYYMAESYSGRLFIELLQNADDAKATRIITYYNHGNIYFANNGKSFDENDLVSISRSGSSLKRRRETIGYRGIGFKSASAISSDIIIYSSNAYFTFSKEKCSQILGVSPHDIPTIRIPLFLEEIDSMIDSDINLLKCNGFSTVFVFQNANIDLYHEETREVNAGYFIFLNNICECTFDMNGFTDRYEIKRFQDSIAEHVMITNNSGAEEWMVYKNGKAAVSFLIENDCIIPCNDNQAVYHCYLPTLERSFMACKINADFSTDPSRKHIAMDDITKDSLNQIGDLLYSVLEFAFEDAISGKYRNLLNIFLKKSTISKINFYLDGIIEDKLTSNKWLNLRSGNRISPVEYKTFPPSFDITNAESIRIIPGEIASNSLSEHVYKSMDNVETFMELFSTNKFDLRTISTDLSNPNFVKKLSSELHIQLLTCALRECKIEAALNPSNTISIRPYIVKNSQGIFDTIGNIVNKQESLSFPLKEGLMEHLGQFEIAWIQSQIDGIDLIGISSTDDAVFSQQSIKGNGIPCMQPHIAKWRDAEVKCVLIEESLGNIATDVSLGNYGYDVKSISPDGKIKYIEVKSVKSDLSFSLTNNEYTSAHKYGDDYYVCLLLEDDYKLEAHYIQNPLRNAKFEKRIRQWDWICLEARSTAMHFDLTN